MTDPHTHETHHASGGQERDLNVPVILTVGIISTVLLVVIVVGIQAWFKYEQQLEFQRKVVDRPHPRLVELNNAAQSQLRDRIEPAIADTAQRYRSASQEQRSALASEQAQ